MTDASIFFGLCFLAGAAGLADAVSTKIALKHPQVEETSPPIAFLYRRLPFLVFALVIIGGWITLSAIAGLFVNRYLQALLVLWAWYGPVANFFLLRKLDKTTS